MNSKWYNFSEVLNFNGIVCSERETHGDRERQTEKTERTEKNTRGKGKE